MKRSEMVEALAIALRVYHDDYYERPNADSLLAADGILGLLENKGMIPPESESDCLNVFGEKLSNNEWEDE